MKILRLISSYFRGIRLPAIILSCMMSLAVFVGVLTLSRVLYIVYDYTIVKHTTLTDAYYVGTLYTIEELLRDPDKIYRETETAIETLSQTPGVQKVYAAYTASPLEYAGTGISISLIDPGLTEAFPRLKQTGVDFSGDPNGCLLGSKIFNRVRDGGQIELQFFMPEPHAETFSVSGHIRHPYKQMIFPSSGTTPRASDLFAVGDSILMQSTEENVARLSQIAEIQYNPNYIVSLDPAASEEARQEVLQYLNAQGLVTPLETIIANSAQMVDKELKRQLPTPMFLLISSTVAYLSILLLIIRKKAYELSVYHLTGGSKRTCVMLVFLSGCIIALPSLLLNTLFVLLIPQYDWTSNAYLSGISVTPDILYLVFGYYLFTVFLSGLVAAGSMAKHSPLSYLRGAAS